MIKAAIYTFIAGVALHGAAPTYAGDASPQTSDEGHKVSATVTLQPQQSDKKAAMERLSFLDGIWRGTAWTLTPSGKHEIVQTERIGSFLQGHIKVIEGRGYEQDGTVSFNALGVIAYDPSMQTYTISSWTLGQAGIFPFKVRPDGYDWEVPAGPGAFIRYSAIVRGSEFVEVGHRISGAGTSLKIFEMRLHRVSDTSWPAGDAVAIR